MQRSSSSDLFLSNHRSAYSPTTAVKHPSAYPTATHSSTSTASSSSSKSSYWLAWSNVNILGTLILRRAGSPNNKRTPSHRISSSSSDLTETYLEAHNRRQDTISILQDQAQAQSPIVAYGRCSPYYRGLTDSTRIINREKHDLDLHHHQHVSPDRESRPTFSYASPLVIFKRQEWSSCFSSGQTKSSATATAATTAINAIEEKFEGSDTPITKLVTCSSPAVLFPAAAAESVVLVDSAVATGCERTSCELREQLETRDLNEEKPLRERVSSSSEPKPPPPPSTVDFCAKNERVTTAIHAIVGKDQFVWAAKYRPKELGVSSSSEPKPPSPPSPPPPPSTVDFCAKNERVTTAIHAIVGKDQFGWAAKYRPKELADFICNKDQASRMQSLVNNRDCNHLIFEGPPGVGKRTMIWAMLQEAFGPDRLQIREECKAFDLKGESIGRIKVRRKVSSHHIEVNLSDVKGYEKQVIVELIKETHNKMSNQTANIKLDNCQAIILYDADKLSTEARLYIKWLLERYKGFNKFFFCCNDHSKLQPITGVCTVVRLLPPSKTEIVDVLQFIAKQEGITLPPQLAEKIADKSKNNLRQAIRSFEASCHKSYPFTDDQVIWTGWEDDIANIAKSMIEEQSPKQLYAIRGEIQNLIEYDVSPDFIFESLFGELKKRLDEQFHTQLESHYKFYNRNSGNMLDSDYKLYSSHCRREEAGKRLHDSPRMKTHHLLRIEEFMARFMSFYKTSVTSSKITREDEGS